MTASDCRKSLIRFGIGRAIRLPRVTTSSFQREQGERTQAACRWRREWDHGLVEDHPRDPRAAQFSFPDTPLGCGLFWRSPRVPLAAVPCVRRRRRLWCEAHPQLGGGVEARPDLCRVHLRHGVPVSRRAPHVPRRARSWRIARSRAGRSTRPASSVCAASTSSFSTRNSRSDCLWTRWRGRGCGTPMPRSSRIPASFPTAFNRMRFFPISTGEGSPAAERRAAKRRLFGDAEELCDSFIVLNANRNRAGASGST